MCHYWPVKNAIFDMPIRLKGNSKCISSNLLSLLGWGEGQNMDVDAVSEMLLTGV